MTKNIYGPTNVQINLNSYDSDLIMILRGTKQGCPLSPLLFNRATKVLVTALRSNNKINRIKMGDKTYLLNLFVVSFNISFKSICS